MRTMKTGMLLLLLLLLAASSVVERADATAQESSMPVTCSPANCRLPLCKCSNTERPSGIELDDTPMMIGLTFSGVLATQYAHYIKRILNPIFKNPNGCAVEATFFLSNSGNGTTDYCFAQTLFNNHNEIAIGAPRYTCPYTDCESLGRYFLKWREDSADADIYEQKRDTAVKARINRSFLRGFRLPFLDQRGNFHYRALKKYAFSYDSSALVRPDDIKKNNGFRQWPHTLDFPANYTCPTCPTKKSLCKDTNCSMSGVWVVPLHYLNAEGKHPCPTLIKDEFSENRMDTRNCVPRTQLTQKLLEEQLFDNFNRHYRTNKAPFVLNIETIWFEEFGDMLTEALVKFINELTVVAATRKSPSAPAAAAPQQQQQSRLIANDVYFVSVSKIVEWIEYPTALNVIANKWLWDCDGANYDYDEECESVRKMRESSDELIEMRKRNRTQLLELRAEDLFRNGVLTTVVVVFILSILFTVVYDKYQ